MNNPGYDLMNKMNSAKKRPPVDWLILVCPLCKGSLAFENETYTCSRCVRNYPLILGIPDFRIFPDSYIDYQDDYQKAKLLQEQADEDKLDFRRMTELYWKMTPMVSPHRAKRFIRHSLALIDKGLENLIQLEAAVRKRHPLAINSVLEVGCGTGGFVIAAKEKFSHVIGVDIAFRWLVIARRRIEECGLTVPLICCCAEYLPFADDSFDLVVAQDVLEHVQSQDMAVRECYRMLTQNGVLFIATPNRFSIMPEPHVRVWGVGLLPRRWMNYYVKLIKGIPYEHLKVLSYPELKKLLRNSPFQDYQIVIPPISEGERLQFSAFEKAGIALYELVRKVPFLRLLLYIIGPFFHALCHARREIERKHAA